MIYIVLIIVSLVTLAIIFFKKIPDIRKINLPKIIDNKSVKTIEKEELKQPKKIFSFSKKQTDTPKNYNFFAKTSSNDEVLFDEADMFFRHGNIAEAEKLYIKVASINPKNIKVYNRLGVIYMQKKEFIDAKEAFLMAVRLDPKKASRHFNLATAYDELREYRNAQESLEQALKIDKDNKKYLKYLEDLKQKIDYRYEQMKRKED